MAYTFSVKKLFFAVCTAAASTAALADYSKLVMFGDSMSDTHRLFEISKALYGKGFPAPPSYKGRVCDGPVTVEYLADNLHLPLQNYAFAGATSGYDSLLLLPLGVLTQVNEYLNNNAVVPTITTIPLLSSVTSKLPGTGRADPKALHMIWTGPDDFYRPNIGMNSATAQSTLGNVKQAVNTLYDAGARYFFIPLMPDLSLTPSAKNHETVKPGYSETARQMSDLYAGLLTQALIELRQRYPQAHIMSHDTVSYMRKECARVRAEGKILDQACRSGGLDIVTLKSSPTFLCTNTLDYVFWDGNHPTTWVNAILGAEWAPAITDKP
jgi:phospholipase/lecithinase/hemolysin